LLFAIVILLEKLLPDRVHVDGDSLQPAIQIEDPDDDISQ
jgi:hypothetical protein